MYSDLFSIFDTDNNQLLNVSIKGESRFVCGSCTAEWPYEEVRKMALLTPEEMEYFETKMASNTAMKYFDTKLVSFCLKFHYQSGMKVVKLTIFTIYYISVPDANPLWWERISLIWESAAQCAQLTMRSIMTSAGSVWMSGRVLLYDRTDVKTMAA